ncbi:MAG: hypothetical protein CL912_26350 [Deltaproteobacteria bacterium]|nr:hypothetical protein [Deltaproteobacteria bacterium]
MALGREKERKFQDYCKNVVPEKCILDSKFGFILGLTKSGMYRWLRKSWFRVGKSKEHEMTT